MRSVTLVRLFEAFRFVRHSLKFGKRGKRDMKFTHALPSAEVRRRFKVEMNLFVCNRNAGQYLENKLIARRVAEIAKIGSSSQCLLKFSVSQKIASS